MKCEPIEIISDSEIDEFIRREKSRLGDNLIGFEVTWARNETDYLLELWSLSTQFLLQICGHGTKIGSALVEDYASQRYLDSLDRVISTGRQLYYRLRKAYPDLKFTRDLGKV